jgi:hypothetical protein
MIHRLTDNLGKTALLLHLRLNAAFILWVNDLNCWIRPVRRFLNVFT